ncbi:sperm acrosome membrane-associated protein 4 [Tiliqua scincoides]|uniref:sperm acrosome membrane-associated protein 4 n=1 Tax=Tiliqua scincoides TaxID=71010 RepID=UPI00346327CD
MQSLLLSLICLLACRTHLAFSKKCFFCEITSSVKCPSTMMSCGEDEDCFVGEGAALGVSMIKNKGCTRAINCGKEQPVSHMGVTYSLVTNCCKGTLCNAAQTGPTTPSLVLQLVLTSLLLLGLLQLN